MLGWRQPLAHSLTSHRDPEAAAALSQKVGEGDTGQCWACHFGYVIRRFHHLIHCFHHLNKRCRIVLTTYFGVCYNEKTA